jgi:hypothetical protein
MDAGALRCVSYDDAKRVTARHISHRQGRIIGAHRARTHDYGVALGPQAVAVGTSRLARNPSARAVGSRGAAVGSEGELEHDPRSAGAAVLDVGRQLVADKVFANPDIDLDPGGAELSDAGAGNAAVGVLDADDDARDAGVDDGICARGRPAVEGARFEGCDEGRPACAFARRVESDPLGMAAAGRLGGTLEVAWNDEATDPGVRRG